MERRVVQTLHKHAWLSLLLAPWLGAAAGVAGEPIPWRAGLATLPSASAESLAIAGRQAQEGNRHLVVQLSAPAAPALRAALAERGLRLLRYVGGGGYFAALDPAHTDPVALAKIPELTGLAPVHPDWKLHPAFRNGAIPEWAVVSGGGEGNRYVAAYVVLHADVELAAGSARLQAVGVRVRSQLRSVNGLVVELPEAGLPIVAAADDVQWIEPPLPLLSGVNDGNRARTQAEVVQEPPYNLDGSGVMVVVYDGGTARATHVDFQGRLNVLDSSGTISHATHVAGTIGGAGVANATYRGMAPGVTLLSYGLQGAGSSGPLYTDPGDLETDFDDAINGYGAVLSNTSLGSNVEANGFDCAWQGDYGVTDALIDAIVCGSLGAPFRMVWAGGNERSGSRCDVEGYGDYYSIAPPAGAKNHMTVGAVNSNDDSMTTFSSWGPTDDGRIKPDVCAPGCQSNGDFGVTSCNSASDTSYTTLCGTSMASPTVCGLCALVLQDFQAHFPGQPLPRNSTLRALFAQTAVDLGNPGPDYKFGYGSVRVQDAIDLLRAGRFGEDVVDQGGSYTRIVTVDSGAPQLKVTLAWDDVPAVPNANVTLVNDLDLQVIGPDGTSYYPWTLDPLSPASPAVRTQADHVNNIEQVLVDDPSAGEWTIAVVGYNVPDGPQTFSLAGDGAANVATVISFPNGLPEIVGPGEGYALDVWIAAYGQSVVPDTARMHYRVDDGPFAELPLTSVGGELYRVTLPARDCGEKPTYYVSVETSVQGTVTEPSNAPAVTLTHRIGEWSVFFADDFEQDQGWSVYAGAYTGNWERADPQQVLSGATITQPEDDHSVDGMLCYVTGALAGSSPTAYDVDGGPSHLTSPVFNLAGQDAKVSYWRWYYMGVNLDDALVVAVTNDGLNWTPTEEVRRSASEWEHAAWQVSDFVVPTATVQVRFTVNDTDPGSLIEALVDDFLLEVVTCTPPLLTGDLNCDGVVDFGDINPFVLCVSDFAAWQALYPDCNPLNADINSDGTYGQGSFGDINPFVALLTGGS
jgi:hypothetical protein